MLLKHYFIELSKTERVSLERENERESTAKRKR